MIDQIVKTKKKKKKKRRELARTHENAFLLLITLPKVSSSCWHFQWSLLIGPRQSPPPLQQGQPVVLAAGNLQRAVYATNDGRPEAERLLRPGAAPALHAHDAAQAGAGGIHENHLAERHPLARSAAAAGELGPLLRRALRPRLGLRRLRARHVVRAPVKRRRVARDDGLGRGGRRVRLQQAPRRALRRGRPGLLQRAPVVVRELARGRHGDARRRPGGQVARQRRGRGVGAGAPLLAAAAAGVEQRGARAARGRPRLGAAGVHLHDLGTPVVAVRRGLHARRQPPAAVRRHPVLDPRVVRAPLLLRAGRVLRQETARICTRVSMCVRTSREWRVRTIE
jgi:hypothetical protein